MKIWSDYYKVLDVIDSCESIEQLKTASKMLIFWYEKHLDRHVYFNTFQTHIERKFRSLNGQEITELPYKSIEI